MKKQKTKNKTKQQNKQKERRLLTPSTRHNCSTGGLRMREGNGTILTCVGVVPFVTYSPGPCFVALLRLNNYGANVMPN